MTVRLIHEPETSSAEAKVLGRYALTSELAAGELTTLYRAQPLDPASAGVQCTIKRLRPRHAEDNEQRALFLAAGRAALRVRSPNLVRTFELCEQPSPFLVLERIEGVTLSQLLVLASRRNVLRSALPILVDALHGLQTLHDMRAESGAPAALAHGAPSARHIVVGVDGVARVVDLTHVIGPGLPWSSRRDERLRASEMAPEQVLAPTYVDPRCDVFIVGSTLWEALTGRSLFGGDSRDSALESMLRKPIAMPGEVCATLGRGVDSVCMRALERSRAERFQSAAEMASALRIEGQRAGSYASREEIGRLVQAVIAQSIAQAPLRVQGPEWQQRPSSHAPQAWTNDIPEHALRTTLVGLGFGNATGPAAPSKFRPKRPNLAGSDAPQAELVRNRLPASAGDANRARGMTVVATVPQAAPLAAQVDSTQFGWTGFEPQSAPFHAGVINVPAAHVPVHAAATSASFPFFQATDPSQVARSVSLPESEAWRAPMPTSAPAQPGGVISRRGLSISLTAAVAAFAAASVLWFGEPAADAARAGASSEVDEGGALEVALDAVRPEAPRGIEALPPPANALRPDRGVASATQTARLAEPAPASIVEARGSAHAQDSESARPVEPARPPLPPPACVETAAPKVEAAAKPAAAAKLAAAAKPAAAAKAASAASAPPRERTWLPGNRAGADLTLPANPY